MTRKSQIPRATFHNLPEDKREKVLAAALHEFARHDYAAANLDRIAAAAGVPKGSLYQYFGSKESLYALVLSEGLERALALFETSLGRKPPADAFALFRSALVFALTLFERSPDLAWIYLRVGYLPATAQREAVLPRLREMGRSFTDRLLDMGIAEGTIDPAVDRPAAAFLLDALSQRFHETVLLAGSGGAPPLTRRARERLADALVDLARRALAPSRRQRRTR